MNQTYISLRFEQMEIRFSEIDILIDLAITNQHNIDIYQALCRSAHVLLVSHFEGLYKEICRDIIDDINTNTKFFEVKRKIFNSHCSFFIQNNESEKATNEIRNKLWNEFREYPSRLKVEPFLYVDNRNPTPDIIETILEKFGIKNFFKSIEGSTLDLVFEDQKSKNLKIKKKLFNHLRRSTFTYPYTTDISIYNPIQNETPKNSKTLWQDFLNNFLKDRHNIIHGHTITNPTDHESLSKAKLKIEILLYTFIINLCNVSTPLLHLPERISNTI